MFVDIGGVEFFEWLLKDGEIEPDSGNTCLQEKDGELLDNASQFTTNKINNPEDHDISDNFLINQGMKSLQKKLQNGGKDAVQLLFISISLALCIQKLDYFQKKG